MTIRSFLLRMLYQRPKRAEGITATPEFYVSAQFENRKQFQGDGHWVGQPRDEHNAPRDHESPDVCILELRERAECTLHLDKQCKTCLPAFEGEQILRVQSDTLEHAQREMAQAIYGAWWAWYYQSRIVSQEGAQMRQAMHERNVLARWIENNFADQPGIVEKILRTTPETAPRE